MKKFTTKIEIFWNEKIFFTIKFIKKKIRRKFWNLFAYDYF